VPELEALVQNAVKKGARVIAGGHSTKVDGRGRFFEATLLSDVPQDADLMQRESFGPLVVIAPVDSDEEALTKMNDSKLGLTASVWTKDAQRARKMARGLDAGTIYMNRCDSVDPALPWTGVKDSGRGSSLSALGFDALTRPKSIHFRLHF
jgi:acyl-CoA reductase-like NAD-dependent aldehyde dehydrogenase